jgi:light-regulated signal transduction histidine kinase (bacteriophytochrome)
MQAQAQPISSDCHVPLHADSLHDLSSPVNQVSTMLELYIKRRQKEKPGDEDMVLNLMRESASRLQSLLKALQEYSGVANSPWEVRRCDSEALLAMALTFLELPVRESEAQVTHDELPEIDCDPSRIAQVLTRLIDNAVKFRGEGTPLVHISAKSAGGEWIFSVRDNGIGIQPRHHDAIFHMFRRLNGDRYCGAGAGLAIAHGIVARHGGRIWVDSGLGAGSTFYFTIPCTPGPQRA